MVKVKEALHSKGSMLPYPGIWSTERWHFLNFYFFDVPKAAKSSLLILISALLSISERDPFQSLFGWRTLSFFCHFVRFSLKILIHFNVNWTILCVLIWLVVSQSRFFWLLSPSDQKKRKGSLINVFDGSFYVLTFCQRAGLCIQGWDCWWTKWIWKANCNFCCFRSWKSSRVTAIWEFGKW